MMTPIALQPALHERPPAPALAAIVGEDPGLRAVLARAARLAPTSLPVLVSGESGTGKELLARALHELGRTPRGPFVAVNCGALSRELAESELFGHERGSFTGAGGRRAGWFEEASGGTLVLDEVGELPLELQPKLLRVLETGRLRRVGGSGEIAVDVRVVAMTLRDLRRDAARGAFRLDLYHRLAGCELTLPPLRQRPGDVALLVRHILAALASELGPCAFTAAALTRLATHDWPGNVRELRNVVRRLALLAGPVIDEEALALDPAFGELRLVHRAADEASSAQTSAPIGCWAAPTAVAAAAPVEPAVGAAARGVLQLRGKSFLELEREIFSWALGESAGSRRRAARLLGISRSTFCDRVKRLGLVPDLGPLRLVR